MFIGSSIKVSLLLPVFMKTWFIIAAIYITEVVVKLKPEKTDSGFTRDSIP